MHSPRTSPQRRSRPTRCKTSFEENTLIGLFIMLFRALVKPFRNAANTDKINTFITATTYRGRFGFRTPLRRLTHSPRLGAGTKNEGTLPWNPHCLRGRGRRAFVWSAILPAYFTRVVCLRLQYFKELRRGSALAMEGSESPHVAISRQSTVKTALFPDILCGVLVVFPLLQLQHISRGEFGDSAASWPLFPRDADEIQLGMERRSAGKRKHITVVVRIRRHAGVSRRLGPISHRSCASCARGLDE